jgi:hypothetical protein
MNFNVIGGTAGGGGGPVGAGRTPDAGLGADVGSGGAVFGLKRKRFRSAASGLARSAERASSCTSGALSAGSAARPRAEAVRLP